MSEQVRAASEVIRRGGTVLYPTETVWGIGCDATNAAAVAAVYRLKQRSDSKAMLTLVCDLSMLERYVDDIPEVAYELLEAAVNPLTIVYDHPVGLADNLRAADGSAGVRVTQSPFARALCRAVGRPIVSTSANLSGQPTPIRFDRISPEIVNGVDFAVDFGRDLVSAQPPSSVIKLSAGGLIRILRK